MKRPVLKPGDVCTISRRCFQSRFARSLFVVLSVHGDGSDRNSIIQVVAISEYSSIRTRKIDMSRAELWFTGKTIDHTQYLRKTKVVGTNATSKATNQPQCIEVVYHPEYIGTLARRSYLEGVENDIARKFKRTTRIWPMCGCGEPKELQFKHSKEKTEAWLGCTCK